MLHKCFISCSVCSLVVYIIRVKIFHIVVVLFSFVKRLYLYALVRIAVLRSRWVHCSPLSCWFSVFDLYYLYAFSVLVYVSIVFTSSYSMFSCFTCVRMYLSALHICKASWHCHLSFATDQLSNICLHCYLLYQHWETLFWGPCACILFLLIFCEPLSILHIKFKTNTV